MATMKHFPGIGRAIRNTDHYVETIDASRAALASDLQPYRRAIVHDIPFIMLSNATYTAYDPDNAAGWSEAIAIGLARDQLGFEGVTITDSLDGTAHARGLTDRVLAKRAAKAGTDMILDDGLREDDHPGLRHAGRCRTGRGDPESPDCAISS